jgi:hypothetical protein
MRGLTWRRSYRVYRALPVESNIRCSALASARESHATPSQHTYIARLKSRRHHAKQHQQLPLREAMALYRWTGSWATAKIQSTEVACFSAPAVLPLKTVACPDVRAGFGSWICLTEQGSAWIKGIATDDLFMVHGTRFCKHRIQVLYLTVASLIIIFIVRTCPEYVDLQILYMAKVAQLGPHMDLFGWFWFSWRPWRWVFRQSFWIFLFSSWISIWSCSHYLCSRFFS